MEKDLFPPQAVQVHRHSRELEIIWMDGSSSRITFTRLRQYCACSSCRAKNLVGREPDDQTSAVTGIELVGTSGIQVQFGDGHQRGIYPWPYLYAFEHGQPEDYLYE